MLGFTLWRHTISFQLPKRTTLAVLHFEEVDNNNVAVDKAHTNKGLAAELSQRLSDELRLTPGLSVVPRDDVAQVETSLAHAYANPLKMRNS